MYYKRNIVTYSLIFQFSDALIDPLVSIINMSLSECIFPIFFKEARVCPTYKKGEVTKCENYRPISLLSNISKLFERVMCNRRGISKIFRSFFTNTNLVSVSTTHGQQ